MRARVRVQAQVSALERIEVLALEVQARREKVRAQKVMGTRVRRWEGQEGQEEVRARDHRTESPQRVRIEEGEHRRGEGEEHQV